MHVNDCGTFTSATSPFYYELDVEPTKLRALRNICHSIGLVVRGSPDPARHRPKVFPRSVLKSGQFSLIDSRRRSVTLGMAESVRMNMIHTCGLGVALRACPGSLESASENDSENTAPPPRPYSRPSLDRSHLLTRSRPMTCAPKKEARRTRIRPHLKKEKFIEAIFRSEASLNPGTSQLCDGAFASRHRKLIASASWSGHEHFPIIKNPRAPQWFLERTLWACVKTRTAVY
jgi:hypothetical protein